MRDLLTRVREFLLVPDGDAGMRALVRTYETCRTRAEKAAGARYVAGRLDEMAQTASTVRAGRLREEAGEWRALQESQR